MGTVASLIFLRSKTTRLLPVSPFGTVNTGKFQPDLDGSTIFCINVVVNDFIFSRRKLSSRHMDDTLLILLL